MVSTLGVLPSAMACKTCGELCRCSEPEVEVSRRIAFSDPDSYDPSEEQFASSLASTSSSPAEEEEEEAALIASSTLAESLQRARSAGPGDMSETVPIENTDSRSSKPDDPINWKNELSTRLSKYKARRREQLGQSSLDFSFESTAANHVFLQPEGGLAESDASFSTDNLADTQLWTPSHMGSAAPDLQASTRPMDVTGLFAQPTKVVEDETVPPLPPDVGKLIEFPRTNYLAPAVNPVELAEPVLDSPRILDVPENIPAPPPPLSDIELDPASAEIDPHLLEPALDIAPLPQRLFSSAVDCILVLAAFALFATIGMKICGPALFADKRTALLVLTVVPATLWAIYNYLFLVHNGRTIGMSLARLRLVTFDSAPVRRTTRKFRAAALQLSCLSLGLGLLWAFIDEDQICWHDRITHTYLRSQ